MTQKQHEISLGFAGLGRMGSRMAANCVRAGFHVTVWNRSAGPTEELVSHCTVDIAQTPAALAADVDVVITMLANDAAAREVYLGKHGLIDAEGASTLVEMGTMSPALVKELAAAAANCNKTFIDAPVSGATEAATNAQLLIMAGAKQKDFTSMSPVFSAMGRKTIWLGQTGNGAIMKLAVNMLIHGLNQTLAEALTLVNSAGMDVAEAFDVIENSAAAAPMLTYRRELYIDELANDVSFTVDLAAKDVALALELGKDFGVTMPQTQTTMCILKEAINADYGERDMASIVNFMIGKSR